MSRQDDALFRAFQEDHAVLGRGFHEISTCLRGEDLVGACAAARRVDREAGAHIVFEEEVFYPTLRKLIGGDDVDALYGDHGAGYEVVRELTEADPEVPIPDARRKELLRASESMERHIAHCEDLFGALGRIPAEERRALYQRLTELRARGPRWTEWK